MITVFEKERYICVWGIPQETAKNDLVRYITEGYKVITVSNGFTSIQDCIKAVVQAAMN